MAGSLAISANRCALASDAYSGLEMGVRSISDDAPQTKSRQQPRLEPHNLWALSGSLASICAVKPQGTSITVTGGQILLDFNRSLLSRTDSAPPTRNFQPYE